MNIINHNIEVEMMLLLKVRWPKDNDNTIDSCTKRKYNYDDGYLLSRCYLYGHHGLSPLNLIESYSNNPDNVHRRL
ncbi:hypothetical protein BLA29_005862, partial [Euroglyphus maynei]